MRGAIWEGMRPADVPWTWSQIPPPYRFLNAEGRIPGGCGYDEMIRASLELRYAIHLSSELSEPEWTSKWWDEEEDRRNA